VALESATRTDDKPEGEHAGVIAAGHPEFGDRAAKRLGRLNQMRLEPVRDAGGSPDTDAHQLQRQQRFAAGFERRLDVLGRRSGLGGWWIDGVNPRDGADAAPRPQ
jgi:hypothetical protein